jgi:hypothetical protein
LWRWRGQPPFHCQGHIVIRNGYISDYGADHMKQSIDTGQQRIACWINKEGRDEMNLAPISLPRVAIRPGEKCGTHWAHAFQC